MLIGLIGQFDNVARKQKKWQKSKNETFLMKMRSTKAKNPLVPNKNIIKIGCFFTKRGIPAVVRDTQGKSWQKWRIKDQAQKSTGFLETNTFKNTIEP